MIDDLKQVSRLLVKLEESLPVAATLTAQAVDALTGQSFPAGAPRQCQVTAVHYLGQQGGIVCRLDDKTGESRGESRGEFLASITHLEFDRRQPIARDIAAYQGQRMERLRRAASRERLAGGGGVLGRIAQPDVRSAPKTRVSNQTFFKTPADWAPQKETP